MKYVKCSCSSEILAVDYDEDIKMLDLCIYKHYSNSDKLNLWDRLRYCFKVLKEGSPYSDQMMIAVDSPDFLTLLEYLNKISKLNHNQHIQEILKFLTTWGLFDLCYWEVIDKVQFYFDFSVDYKIPDEIKNGTDLYELNIEDIEPLNKLLKSIPDHYPVRKSILDYVIERELKNADN
jgi:hypothetical protein